MRTMPLVELVPTIGLEIHVELRTRTKMFCESANDPHAAEPNTNICPVCMAHPGTLPVINSEAVRHVLKVGCAIGGILADYTEFDRKNYFYPDLPKGYQLSQYAYPLVQGGSLRGVSITRIHLEEDTARSTHDSAAGVTKIDYNRAGVPLMELVTEPEIHSAGDAVAFAKELQILLRILGASEANMEKGEMRIEANVSLGTKERLGTKVEIKNLNSFRSVERAIEHELKRQQEVLSKSGAVEQQTLGWDESKQVTFPQRSKEGSADYRYFPDPDLPKLIVSEIPAFSYAQIKSELPELPWEKRARYQRDLGITADDASAYVYDSRLGDFFDAVQEMLEEAPAVLASNYIATDLVKHIRDIEGRDAKVQAKVPVNPSSFAAVIDMVHRSELSSRGVKTLIAELINADFDPREKARELGLIQRNDDASLEPLVVEIIKENPAVVSEFKAGKTAALQFLLGQAMKKSRGAANPERVRTLFEKYLQ